MLVVSMFFSKMKIAVAFALLDRPKDIENRNPKAPKSLYEP